MIIGIDPGTSKIGVAVFDETKQGIKMAADLPVVGQTLLEKLEYVHGSVVDMCLDFDCEKDKFVVEKMFIQNKAAAGLLAMQVVIVDTIKKYNFQVGEYAPTSWKKFMGKGNMQKEEVAILLSKHFDIQHLAYEYRGKKMYKLDATDAIALALCGAANNLEKVSTDFNSYIK